MPTASRHFAPDVRRDCEDRSFDEALEWARAARSTAEARLPVGTPAQHWSLGHALLMESPGIPEPVKVDAAEALYELLFPGRLPR